MTNSIYSKKEYISFVGKSYAYKGFKFYFLGSNDNLCSENCKFYNTCMKNLEPEKVYEVIESMLIEHNCPMNYHLEPMVLVKLIESKYIVAIESRKAFEGSSIIYEPLHCSKSDYENCAYKKYCAPKLGLKVHQKLKILKIIEKIGKVNCKRNLTLIEIEKI